jgi:hypothetical protein
MQPVTATVQYADTYQYGCPHKDCLMPILVTITREKGGKVVAITVKHPESHSTESAGTQL